MIIWIWQHVLVWFGIVPFWAAHYHPYLTLIGLGALTLIVIGIDTWAVHRKPTILDLDTILRERARHYKNHRMGDVR